MILLSEIGQFQDIAILTMSWDVPQIGFDVLWNSLNSLIVANW